MKTGRFAPSPTGRMHLGNLFTALLSWLSVRKAGGRWILRIEDLDPQRSRMEYARQIEDDLDWLGLSWDEGGVDGSGSHGPYCQSMRHDIYAGALDSLVATGLTYPCYCRRADILATQAPHQSDGRVIYAGTCRPRHLPVSGLADPGRPASTRICVPDEEIGFVDGVFGRRTANLTQECGDFVLRRADGAWAYQLAVVVDDAMMGVTEVVRGCDLLLSTAQQLYLYRLSGWTAPDYAHVPLLCNAAGQRLSKRDMSLNMAQLRTRFTPGQIIGRLAALAGLISGPESCRADELVGIFDWNRVPAVPSVIVE